MGMRLLALAPTLHTDRNWAVEPASPVAPPADDDDCYGPLAEMMTEVARELEADGMAVG